METVTEFLNRLAEKGVKLSAESGQVHCHAQKGVLTSEIKDGIIRYKPEIVALFEEREKPKLAQDADSFRVSREFPLSAGQKGLYVQQMMQPGMTAYNVPLCFRIFGAVHQEAMDKAWLCVLEQFPILTARIVERDGELYQNLDRNCQTTIQHRSLKLADEELAPFLREQARRPFALDQGPLTRVQLFTLDEAKSILLITVHHIVFDGISAVLVLQAFFAFYRQLCEGKAVRFPHDLAGYQKFVAWEEEMLACAEGQGHADYWQHQLSGEMRSIELFPGFPRVAPGDEGRTQIEFLPESLSSWIHTFVKNHSLLPSAFFLAMFQLLLSRYSNQGDIVVGMPVTNRGGGKFATEVGYFVNMVPIRTNCEGWLKLDEFLHKVQSTMLDAIHHSSYPFPLMFNKLSRQGEQNPIRISYAYQNFAKPGDLVSLLSQQTLALEAITEICQEEDFDAGIEIFEDQQSSFIVHLKYNPQVYTQQAMGNLLEHYCALLRTVSKNPNLFLQEYPVLTEREEQTLLIDFNNTEAEFPRNECLHQLVKRQVASSPDSTAVVAADGGKISYRELYERSGDLALYLQSIGVKPDTLVGLCVERSLQMVVGLLGILLAGGAYVPLDPEYPDERLAYMLQDSGATIIVTQQKLQNKLGALIAAETELIPLDGDGATMKERVAGLKARKAGLADEVKPHNLAYVIYTSGSTGTPKGVLVEHRSVVNYTMAAAQRYAMTSADRMLQFFSLSFDAAAEEIFPTLARGATLVLRPNDLLTDMEHMLAWLARADITVLSLPTAVWHSLVVSLGQPGNRLPTTLRVMIIGGERALPQRVREWRERVGHGVRLFNTYGPTEATIVATVSDLTIANPEAELGREVSIGQPVANARVYVLDPLRRPVPLGVTGELYIGGVGVARGYQGQWKLTAERFMHDPFGPSDGRMYKTGDLVRFRGDGELEFRGRVDDQVKIRGYRIELGEIEAHLNQYPKIRESAVVVRGEETSTQLIAFYQANGTNTDHLVYLPNKELREHLLRTLPEYMMPAAFVSLVEIPLDPNGKVDRRSLLRMEVKIDSDQEYVPPRNDTERQLVEIWSQILNLPFGKIGVNHSFFELGGHSLLVTQLISRVRSQLNIELSLKDLFERPSVAQLAQSIAKARKSQIPPIRPIDRAELERLPLSFAQERLWFIHQLDPESAGYNLPGAVTIHGELDIGPLEQAVNLIIARHESLRTVFPNWEGQVHQLIMDRLEFRFERIDLSHNEDKKERDDKVNQICQKDATTAFDLSLGPLIRGKIIKLAVDEHVLMFNLHHIVCDGWSIEVFTQELDLSVGALRQGRLPELLPLPIQYADYSAWQRTWLEQGGILKQQLAYWQEKLAGAPESLDLVTDYPRPSTQSFAGAAHAFAFDPELTGQLKALAEHESGTLFMVLLAAFKVLLYRYSGQTDICVGTPIANRQYAETEALIGMFANTLVLRDCIEGGQTFAALLSQVKATCLEAYEHQDAPFEKIVDLLRVPRNPGISPLFQVMVVMQSMESKAVDRNLHPRPLHGGISKFDISAEFTETPEGLIARIEYSTALYKPPTIERMAQHFLALCRSIVLSPMALIRDLEYIDESQKRQLIQEFNRTQASYPQDKCIHDLFAEQAVANPDATAVVVGEAKLSYRELFDRSIDLALYLQSLNVTVESIVGIYLERSLEMMVGIVGVVQAGAAYLPIDTESPDDRISYMLQDSQPSIVVTQEKFKDRLGHLLPQSAKLIVLDAQWPEICASAVTLRKAGAKLRREVQPHNACYVIYTSGSTGRPKGVVTEHRALMNRISWMQRRYSLNREDVVLQKTPYTFDVSVWEFFWPIMAGASLIFAAPGGHRDVDYLQNLITRMRVTTMHFVPSMLRAFLDHAGSECNSVRQIFCSGELLDRKSVDRYKTNFPNASMHNLYGPTEAAIDVTAFDCSQINDPFVPIGTPIDNIQIYILDEQDGPQPIGVPGELHIAGDGLARGYLNRSELTREKFVADPFRPGARMYKTGDLARWLDDGNIQYLGRIDTQVKIRGFRIELMEIEARLNQHSMVRDSVVVAQGHQEREQRLVAFYQAQDTKEDHLAQVPDEGLRAHLMETLPEYMVPVAFVSLAVLPLSANGKADRRALSRMDVTIASSREYLAPRNDRERQLAEFWGQVLNVAPEKIGINDDFFQLGGHSLLAVQLLAKINKRFKQLLPLAVMFTAPTVASLAQLISDDDAKPIDILVPIQTQGTAVPIFGVPGAGGNVLSLQPLSRALGTDQPFYALEAVGVDGKTAPLSSVEQTAAANIRALKTIQPVGPYRLIGHSYGGVIAYEMARILLEQNEEISSLALLDSIAPGIMQESLMNDDVTGTLDACMAAANLYGITMEIDVDRLRPTSGTENLQYVSGLFKAHGLEIDASQLAAFYDVYRANMLCYRAYKPSMLPRNIDVFLYVATQENDVRPDIPADYGWNRLLRSPIHVCRVDANHFSILRKVQLEAVGPSSAHRANVDSKTVKLGLLKENTSCLNRNVHARD